MCRQRAGCNAGASKADGQRPWWDVQAKAGCNPGAAKADGQRAWWKLPRSVLGVLRV